MLKKLSLILATIFLMACSNTKIVEENTKKSEIIRQAISTPEKNIILLGDNYDYYNDIRVRVFYGKQIKIYINLI